MPSVGPVEILMVFIVALIVFGPQKLPELGRQLGKAVREFQKVQDSFSNEVRSAFDVNEAPRAPAPPIARSGLGSAVPANPEGALGHFDRPLPPAGSPEDAAGPEHPPAGDGDAPETA